MSGQMYNDDIASDVKISSYGGSLSLSLTLASTS